MKGDIPPKILAPAGALWVCGACGKSSNCRMDVGDESCYMWATLCDEKSIQRGPDGRVVQASVWAGSFSEAEKTP